MSLNRLKIMGKNGDVVIKKISYICGIATPIV